MANHLNPNRGSSPESSKKYLNIMSMEDLTKDIMQDILSQLDFKTVLCCQCVCKSWRDLVLDPYFINKLLWSSKKNPSLMIHDLNFPKPGRLKWAEIQDKVVEVEKEQLVDVVTIHDVGLSEFLSQIHSSVLVGPSINGLICVWGDYRNTYIVNPIAKQYLTLPAPAPELTTLPNILTILGYGFGSLDDVSYKVIKIIKRARPCETIQIEVFTLGTDKWRALQPNDHLNDISGYMGNGLFFNGSVHWINYGGHKLFVFQLDNETFNLFPSPPFEGEEKQHKYSGILGVLKGCLSQACWYFSPLQLFTVWVMKQHAIKDSWYKAFTIEETLIAHKLHHPLCLLDGLKGGILIAISGCKVVAYCLETNTLRTINLTSSPATSNILSLYIKSISTYHPTFLNLQNFASPNTPVQNF